MRKIYSLLFVAMLFCLGCEWRQSNSEDNPDWLLTVSRYDRVQSLYLTTGDLSALQQMNREFPQQTRTLIEDMLHLGHVNDPQINAKFLCFYQDSTLQQLIAETQKQYADMSDINKQLSDAFERLLKVLPDICLPDVYTQVGALDQSVFISGDVIGISLDKYLGSDYPLYLKYGYTPVQRQTMRREYIVPDCIGFYLLSLYPMPSDTLSTLEQREEHIGRIQWVVNRVMKRHVFETPYTQSADRYMREHRGMKLEKFLTIG